MKNYLKVRKKIVGKFYVAIFFEGWTVVSRLHLVSLGKIQWFGVVFCCGVWLGFFNFIINGKNLSSYHPPEFWMKMPDFSGDT